MQFVAFAFYGILAGLWTALVGYVVLRVLGVRIGRETPRQSQRPSASTSPAIAHH